MIRQYTGKDKLPDLDVVVDRLFKRKEFIPDKLGTSLLLAFMSQHFTHQLFKTDFKTGAGYTFGAQVVSKYSILFKLYLKLGKVTLG